MSMSLSPMGDTPTGDTSPAAPSSPMMSDARNNRSQIARARWVLAIWYALQEVQRIRAERRAHDIQETFHGPTARSTAVRGNPFAFRRDSAFSHR
jgi:hypothetical protein